MTEIINKPYQRYAQALHEIRVSKDTKGLHGLYAGLDCILDSAKEILAKYDLALICKVSGQGSDITVSAYVRDAISGAQLGEVSSYTIDALSLKDPTDPKTLKGIKLNGAVITYLRRYVIRTLLCISDGADDLDQHDTETPPKQSKQHNQNKSKQHTTQSEQSEQSEQKPANGLISQKQISRLWAIALKEVNMPKDAVKDLIEQYGYQSAADISTDVYEEIITRIEAFE